MADVYPTRAVADAVVAAKRYRVDDDGSEKVVQPVSQASREAEQCFVLALVGTRDARPGESRVYALLNDSEEPVSLAVLNTPRSYDVGHVPWTRWDQVPEERAA